MESFRDLLNKRRSIRDFQDTTVERDKISAVLEAALRAPSAKGLRPWHFIVVEDRATIRRLSQCRATGSSSFLSGAPLAVVVAADVAAASAWVEDASIAAIILQLAAEEEGLGSCWIQVRERETADDRSSSDYIREILDIPSGIEVETVIAIGYPRKKVPPHGDQEYPRNRIHYGRFGGSR
jgi:nitroreductase